MRFPGFYGNEGLKSRLSAAFDQGSMSHCYILSGPEGSGKKTLSKIMAAAMECTGTGVPCGTCPSCRKIFGGGHPDVITIDSDKATVPISVIRDLQTDAYIRPNEGRRKVYLIPRGQDMQAPAQNALLKLIEEPPAYCAFLIMTDNPEKLLSTVRSRAVELSLYPLNDATLHRALRELRPQTPEEHLAAAEEASGGYLGAALSALESSGDAFAAPLNALCDALCAGDDLALLSQLIPLEKWKRTDLLTLFRRWYLILVRALEKRSGGTAPVSPPAARLARGRSGQQLHAAVSAVSRAVTLLEANGSSGHAVGYLMATLTSGR